MKTIAKTRSRARAVALQALYQFDVQRRAASGASGASGGRRDLESFIEESGDDEAVTVYARRLLAGTLDALETIDASIARVVANWTMERIAPVDRCILRLALFELLEMPDVPPKVAINEAIELAKKYSTERSGAFVNGILDRIHQERKEKSTDDASSATDKRQEGTVC